MRIAIVVPRYGEEIGAGAESQARDFAQAAARLGWTVEVWTTCVRNHYSWKNELPEGRTHLNGVTIIRFPITTWDKPAHGRVEGLLATRGKLSLADQYTWLRSSPHSQPLYAHVAEHAGDFDACVMLPYTTPLIHYAAWAAPEKTILWPCLHHESYAYLEPVRLLMESVAGVMFYTPEEQTLAVQLLGMQPRRETVLGGGILFTPTEAQASAYQDLLYVGRLEGGKNVPLLYKYVQRYAAEGKEIRLVVIGNGPLRPPKQPAFDYRGFADEATKASSYATALALCQPSRNESFSRVILESWLSGRPVLVSDNCAVTRGHVQRSKGGLAFRTYEEFAAAVDWLKANPALAARMGRNGQIYTQQNYTWPTVVERFATTMTAWKESEE
jgi:O-antigen biosynthesis protein